MILSTSVSPDFADNPIHETKPHGLFSISMLPSIEATLSESLATEVPHNTGVSLYPFHADCLRG